MRYLVVAKQAPASLDGKIVEVLLSRTTEQVDTLALFTSLYHSAQSGHLAAPGQGTGYVFLYSASYEYLSGRRFAQGQLLPGVTRLAFQPRAGTVAASGRTAGHRAPSIDAPCLDWYSGETGKYITTTGNCSSLGSGGSGDVPPVYTGGGGPCGGSCGGSPGPSGYGGGGGGGVSTPPVVPLSETLVEITQLPPCASQVVSVIKNDNIKLSDALVPFFGSSLKFYPKISAKLLSDNNGKRVAGNTVRDGTNFDPVYNLPVYIININSGTLYGDTHGPGATNIGLAGTVLHELTHAYLIEWNRSKGNITDPNVTLSVLLERYTKQQQFSEISQHELMGRLVEALGSALYSYCAASSILTNKMYCTNLMWSGLTATEAYTKLSQEKKSEIANTMTMENYSTAINSERDADGNTTSINPTGKKACN